MMRRYIISLEAGLLGRAELLAASQTICSVSYSDCINPEVSALRLSCCRDKWFNQHFGDGEACQRKFEGPGARR